MLLDGLARLIAGYEAGGLHEAVLPTARRLLRQDPLREDAHRAAMRAYCRLGQRNAALEQYGLCRQIVREDLGAEPMAETTELYQAILDGRYAVEPVPRTLSPLAYAAALPASPGWNPLDRVVPGRLVGREQEWSSTGRPN